MQKRNKLLKGKGSKSLAGPDVTSLEEMLRCVRKCAPTLKVPPAGWIRAVREALGMTNVQLAERLGKVPQSIEDMQKSEAAGSIKLQSLRSLAEAMGCELVYAVVPPKSLAEMRQEQARVVAQQVMEHIHSGETGKQSKTTAARQKDLERLIEKVLAGKPKMLWK